MTPAQCRAARELLDLSAGELARAAGVPISTIVDFEEGTLFIARDGTVEAMRWALEQAGAIFAAANGGSGVKLRK